MRTHARTRKAPKPGVCVLRKLYELSIITQSESAAVAAVALWGERARAKNTQCKRPAGMVSYVRVRLVDCAAIDGVQLIDTLSFT